MISGIFKTNKGLSNVIRYYGNFDETARVKEYIWTDLFDSVYSVTGFAETDIIELEQDDSRIHEAKRFLASNDDVGGIMFLEDGIIVVVDVDFFTAYTLINGKETPYIDDIMSDCFDEELSEEIVMEYTELI